MGFDDWYAQLIYKRRYQIVCGAWCLFIVGIAFGVRAFWTLPSLGFIPPLAESTQVARRFDKSLAQPDYGLIVLCEGFNGLKSTDPQFRGFVGQVRAGLESLKDVVGIISLDAFPYDTRLVSNDGTKELIFATIVGGVGTYTNQELEDAATKLITAPSSSFKVLVGGSIPIAQKINYEVLYALEIAEGVTLPIVFVLLLFAMGGVMASLMSWFLSVGTLCLSLGLVMGFASSRNMSNVTSNAVTMLGVGLSLDFSLLIVLRFIDTRKRWPHVPVYLVIKRVFQTSGKTVLFSAVLLFISSCGGLAFHEY